MSALAGCLAFLFLLMCVSHVALCQDNSASSGHESKDSLPEYIQEFFLSDAVRSQEKGEWQLTAGVDSRHFGISTLLKTEYGVTNRLQFGVELPYGVIEEESLDRTSPWSTVSLGVEYQIMRSDSPFALSAGIAFGIPVRPKRELEYQPTILLAKR